MGVAKVNFIINIMPTQYNVIFAHKVINITPVLNMSAKIWDCFQISIETFLLELTRVTIPNVQRNLLGCFLTSNGMQII